MTEWHISLLWNPSYCHKRSGRKKGKRGTRWPEGEALAMYLHFYGNGLGQTRPWSSVVRGTWGQVSSSWSEAATAAICRGWDGTREQTPKASKPAINRNQELMGFSLRMSNKSCDNLLPYALANRPYLHFPLPLKRLCHGTGDADIRETATGPGSGREGGKCFICTQWNR